MTARATLTLLLLATALGLAACGRKAPLDTPYEAAVEARRQAEREDKPLPPEPEKPVEDRPFILDGLI
ncbi:LPS translocon maturation chaperone LptM [Chelativorans intermedius]|uniref:Lipoprotein n=1 Tax=Chelativorans intermedius TaxID=515947 RepID=A0ABV6DAY0_9HYPH|nr:lipoprotein [Chelativorans intermedius]MCT8998023.1 lipoprotein [Chelativorans intermedius]